MLIQESGRSCAESPKVLLSGLCGVNPFFGAMPMVTFGPEARFSSLTLLELIPDSCFRESALFLFVFK